MLAAAPNSMASQRLNPAAAALAGSPHFSSLFSSSSQSAQPAARAAAHFSVVRRSLRQRAAASLVGVQGQHHARPFPWLLGSNCGSDRLRFGLTFQREPLDVSAKASSVEREDGSNDIGLDQEMESAEGTCDPLCSVDEMSSLQFEANYKPKTDFLKAIAIGVGILGGAAIINHSWVAENQNLAMAIVFCAGYAGIIFEESLVFNKSGVGLLMAVTLWVIRSLGASSPEEAVQQLSDSSEEVSEIVFFLLGAMTIVEIVDAHQGFKLVTDAITTRKPRMLLWVVGGITFFLSSVLDNLTSTIVMVSLLRKLVPNPERRKFLGAVVVIAANAGGAWTPIGDVTTTMLWIHGQISTVQTMQDLFIPSVLALVVPLALMSFTSEVEGNQDARPVLSTESLAPRGQLVFGVGVAALLFVPVFKGLTGLPPYLGMLLGLGTLWLLTDAIHYGESDRQKLKVPQALSRIDTQGVLFFLGILLSVGSLQSAGLLTQLANFLDEHIHSTELIASSIGLASAVVDNVPLVAATMGMYDMTTFPQDAELWQLIAYCAGTGGSILIIGSAAGVAFMGMEKADFFWYLRKVSGFALAGYVAGIGAYLAMHQLQAPVMGFLSHIPLISGS